MKDNILQPGKFKYKALYSWIINQIDTGSFQYNEKLPTEATLCKQFGMSRQTIRNAMDQLSADGYILRVKGSGSYVQKKVIKREKTIGVLFETVGDYINFNILGGLSSRLADAGYSILLDISYGRVDNELRFLHKMLKSNVSGLIIEGTKSSMPTPNEELYHLLTKQNTPYVFLNNYYSNVSCPAVIWDDQQVSYELTESLIASGKKNIAGLFRYDEMQGVNRYLGYIRALVKHGIEVREDLIGWYTTPPEQTKDAERQDMLVERFTADISTQCDALICYNDLIACFTIRCLMANGISVPTQISVASFDNYNVTKLYGLEGITSANHPKEELGRQAAELLLQYIEKKDLDATARNIIKLPSNCTRLD